MIALSVAALPPIAIAHPIVAQRSGEAPAIEMWQVDQVRVSPDTSPAKLAALEPDHSLAAVMIRLKALGVPFTRGRAGLLPDRMPPELRDQIERLPPGEPFVIPGSDYISVNVIVGRILPPNVVRLTPPVRRPVRSEEA